MTSATKISDDLIITLVTGANGGIGFELVHQLLADANNVVLLGSRSRDKGEAAVQTLKERNLPGIVELVQIDVRDEESVNGAAKEVDEKYGRIDALVNNAAITGEYEASLSHRLQDAFLTNSVGPAITVEAFAPLLSKSTKTARIINVTSGAGSIGRRLDYTSPHQKMKVVPYRASKAALNMITACQAYEYGPLGWKVFCFCPGFTESNLGSMNKVEMGAQTTADGARPLVGILRGERDGEHSGFLNATPEGQYPW